MYRDYINKYLKEVRLIAEKIDRDSVNKMIEVLADVRKQGGRLFIIGNGGGAAHASHAVSDFRRLAGIEAYTPTDNVDDLTSHANDNGWHTVFANWLLGSHLNSKDVVLAFSVGGGNAEKNISINIVASLKLAKSVGAKILGVVGLDGGYTKQVADACIMVPVVNAENVTPHTEAFQAVLWHLIVSHPEFRTNEAKWELVRQTTSA